MQHPLSIRMLVMVLFPVFICLLLLILLVIAFNAAYAVAVGVQEADLQELVRLGSSSIERLWVHPREKAVTALSCSPLLQKRIRGEISFDELRREWAAVHPVPESCFFIYYGLENGSIELYPDLQLPEGYDHRNRPWYKKGMSLESSTPAWTSPYPEIITREVIVSTVVQLRDTHSQAIGVFAADITLKGLQEILDGIQLPPGSSVFLLDADGTPFVGTADQDSTSKVLTARSETTFVEYSSPISNGWRIALAVPRKSMAKSFEHLRRSVLGVSFFLFILSAAVLTLHVVRLASRASRLASYFEEVRKDETPLRRVFKSSDEFSFLNQQFNMVILATRKAEEEKIAREQVFRFIIERAPIGFFRTRRDGILLYENPCFRKMLGYSREELKKIDSVERFYAEKEVRENYIDELSQKHEVRGRRIRFQRKSGEVFWISMTSLISPGQEHKKTTKSRDFW